MSDPIPSIDVRADGPEAATAFAPGGAAPPANRHEEAAARLEALFVSQLLKEMREALTEEGFFGSGPGASVFEGLFDQMVAEDLGRGPGIGLREQVLRAWPDDESGARAAAAAAEKEIDGAVQAAVLAEEARTIP